MRPLSITIAIMFAMSLAGCGTVASQVGKAQIMEEAAQKQRQDEAAPSGHYTATITTKRSYADLWTATLEAVAASSAVKTADKAAGLIYAETAIRYGRPGEVVTVNALVSDKARTTALTVKAPPRVQGAEAAIPEIYDAIKVRLPDATISR